jgi:hypothetical protein
MGRCRYAEAGPLVVGDHADFEVRAASISQASRVRLPEAADRVLALCEDWSRRREARAWGAGLGMVKLPPDVVARRP